MKNLALFFTLIFCMILQNSCKKELILDTQVKELYSVKIPNKDFKLNVVYLPSNAGIQSAIQIRKKFKNKEDILANYDRYNYVDDYSLKNDSTFMLVIRDTISVLGNKPDTIYIKIK